MLKVILSQKVSLIGHKAKYNMISKRQPYIGFLIVVLGCLNLYFPTFNPYLGQAGYGLIIILNFLIFLFFLIFANHNFLPSQKNDPLFYIFCFNILLFLISFCVGISIGSINASLRDFFDFYRPLLFFLFYLLGSYATSIEKKTLEQGFNCVFIIFCCFAFVQFVSTLDTFSLLYTKAANVKSSRLSIPFINPYDFGFCISLFSYYYLVNFIKKSFLYIFPFLVSIILILLTQSKAVFVAFIFISFFLGPIFLGVIGRLQRMVISTKDLRFLLLIIGFIVLFLLALDFLVDNFPYLLSSVLRILGGGEIGTSGTIRIEQFETAISFLDRNFILYIFGHGPAKNILPHVESIYTYMIFRFGIVGLLTYFTIIGLVFVRAVRFAQFAKNKDMFFYSFALAFGMWVASVPIVSLGNNFTEQLRSSFLFYFLSGVISAHFFSQKKKNIKNENCVHKYEVSS
jgi:hypothetical protein